MDGPMGQDRDTQIPVLSDPSSSAGVGDARPIAKPLTAWQRYRQSRGKFINPFMDWLGRVYLELDLCCVRLLLAGNELRRERPALVRAGECCGI
jgi:hypothetical protein